jgi:two-component sensor histidine kinase/HAMP domain-containing protein
MEDESSDLASSILQAHKSALITEDYSAMVDHCTQLVSNSKSILYVVITRKDGYSLVHTKNSWIVAQYKGIWLPDKNETKGRVMWSSLVKRNVFHKSERIVFSSVHWGWIHIGLSLDNYESSLSSIRKNTTWLAITMSVLGFVVSLGFAKRLTKPIRILDQTMKRIAEGDLTAEAYVKTGDELESLAHSFNKMTKVLRIAHDELESRVAERTAALGDANEILVNEILERKRMEDSLSKYAFRLEGLQEIYRGIITAKSTNEIVFETMNKLHAQIGEFTEARLNLFDFVKKSAVVHQFSQTGNQVEQKSFEIPIIDFKIEDIQYPDMIINNNLDKNEDLHTIEKDLLDSGIKSYMRSTLNFQGELIGELIFKSTKCDQFSNEDGYIVREISNQLAVAIAQAKLQENLRNHTETLQNSLQEKDVLLKEIHHRVKNNLQIISSLFFLQSSNVKEEENLSIFRDSQSRIKSMALVHEKLYQSEDLSKINFSEYLQNLSSYIHQTYGGKENNIRFIFDLDDIFMTIDTAIPLGLILNELLSNAFKYAFRGRPIENEVNKIITIKSKKLNEQFTFEVSDNGIGLPAGFDIQNCESLGLKLVTNLTHQINGELKIESIFGAKFTISIKHK